MKLRHLSFAAMAASAALAAGTASASLVLVSPEAISGTGIGTVNTVLTIQNTGTETGSVSRFDGADVITGDAKTGASQTLTRTFSEASIASAADLRIVFNAVEPGGDPITLSNLVLSIYSPDGGAALFNSGAFTPVTFGQTFTGTGNSGFVFKLDDAQAAAAQAFYAAGNRIGLSATATGSGGGNETFFVASAPATVTAVPEPQTYALLLAGLGAIGFVARRRTNG